MVNVNSNDSRKLLELTKLHVGIDREVLLMIATRLASRNIFSDMDDFHTFLVRTCGKVHFEDKSRKEWQTLVSEIEIGNYDYSKDNYHLYKHEYSMSLDEFIEIPSQKEEVFKAIPVVKNRKKCMCLVVYQGRLHGYLLLDFDGDALYLLIVTDQELLEEYISRFEEGKKVRIVKMKELVSTKGNEFPKASLIQEEGVEAWAMEFAKALSKTFKAISANLVGRFANFNALVHLWNKKRITMFARSLGYTYIQFLERLFLYMQYGVDVFKYEKALDSEKVLETIGQWTSILKKTGMENHPAQWVKNDAGDIRDGLLDDLAYILTIPPSDSGFITVMVQNAYRRVTEQSLSIAIERYNEFLNNFPEMKLSPPQIGEYEVYPETLMMEELPYDITRLISPVITASFSPLCDAIFSKLSEIGQRQYIVYNMDAQSKIRDEESVTKTKRLELNRKQERRELLQYIVNTIKEFANVYKFGTGRELSLEECVSYMFLTEIGKKSGTKRITITHFYEFFMKWFVNSKWVNGVRVHPYNINYVLQKSVEQSTEVMFGLQALWGGKNYRETFQQFWEYYLKDKIVEIELFPCRVVIDGKIQQVISLNTTSFHGFRTSTVNLNIDSSILRYVDGRIFSYVKIYGYEGRYNCLFKEVGTTYYVTLLEKLS